MEHPLGNITLPVVGDSVGSRIKIKGYVRNIPADRELWIAHKRTVGGIAWPKEPKIIVDETGHFSLTTIEGGGLGPLTVSLLMVTQKIDQEFLGWLERGYRTDDFPGIDILQPGIHELALVQVTFDRTRPLRVFYCYAHEDEVLRKELEKHLAILRRRNLIEEWHDRCIGPGEPYSERILAEINRADIILALVSASFMASDYCYEKEMQIALERHNKGEARLVPIVVRAVDWKHSPISNLLALPTDAKPVKSWPQEDEAWADVAQGLRDVIEELR